MTRTRLLAGAVILGAATLAGMHLHSDSSAPGSSASSAAARAGTATATPPAEPRLAGTGLPPLLAETTATNQPPIAVASQASSADKVAVSFLAPRPTVKQGAAVDVIASLDTLRPLAKISLTIAFDPALLRLRTDEELDFSNDESVLVRPRFRAEILREGLVSLTSDTPPIAGKALIGIVQFEAANAGSGSIDVAGIRFVGDKGNTIPYSVAATNLPVLVN